MKQQTHCFGTLKTKRKLYLQSKLSNFQQVLLCLTQQLWKDIKHCKCLSLQLDHASETAHLCIFILLVFADMRTVNNHANERMQKLTWITTDGAPAMVGRLNGFIAKCRENDAFPDYLNYHCIIHQQALFANAKYERDNVANKAKQKIQLPVIFEQDHFSIWRRRTATTLGCCYTPM